MSSVRRRRTPGRAAEEAVDRPAGGRGTLRAALRPARARPVQGHPGLLDELGRDVVEKRGDVKVHVVPGQVRVAVDPGVEDLDQLLQDRDRPLGGGETTDEVEIVRGRDLGLVRSHQRRGAPGAGTARDSEGRALPSAPSGRRPPARGAHRRAPGSGSPDTPVTAATLRAIVCLLSSSGPGLLPWETRATRVAIRGTVCRRMRPDARWSTGTGGPGRVGALPGRGRVRQLAASVTP